MKHLFLFFLVINIYIPALLAQEVKLKTKERDGIYEEYFVLASDKKVKHGSYFKLYKPFGTGYFSAVGNYDNGKKHGSWEQYYANCNQIEFSGYYKNGNKDSLWVYFYPDKDKIGKNILGIDISGMDKVGLEIKELREVKTDVGTQIQIVNLNNRISAKGGYENNEKVGIWEYYDLGQQLIQKYDFSRDTLLFHNEYDSLKNKPVTFIGGEYEMNKTFYSLFDFHKTMSRINNKLGMDSGVIAVSFEVDKYGNISSKKVLKDELGNKKLLSEALEFIDQLKNCWSPEYVNGIPQNSESIINFVFDVDKTRKRYINERGSGGSTILNFNLRIELENMQ